MAKKFFVIDHLIKYVHLMPLIQSSIHMQTKILLNLLCFKSHEMSKTITSDQDHVFTSKFRQELFV